MLIWNVQPPGFMFSIVFLFTEGGYIANRVSKSSKIEFLKVAGTLIVVIMLFIC